MSLLYLRLFAAAILALPLVAKATDCIEPAPDPTNTYDFQHTFDKNIKKYPFIRIASSELPQGVMKVADQTYVQYGTRCLKLDLYLPSSSRDGERFPTVIIVHGGGWRSGFRSEFVPMAIRLAQRGYGAVTISYRLSGEALYPAAIFDTRAAVRWVRAHADNYRLDPNRFALAGGSAGGQIASLAGVTGNLDCFDPGAANSKVSSAVQAIVNIDGLSDFTSEAARVNEDDPKKSPSAASLWFGGRYSEKSELWAEASPIRYVHAGMPPIIFIDSAQPRFAVGRDEMIEKMKQVGAASEIVFIKDTPHSFWMFDPWLQPTVDATVKFLDRELPKR